MFTASYQIIRIREQRMVIERLRGKPSARLSSLQNAVEKGWRPWSLLSFWLRIIIPMISHYVLIACVGEFSQALFQGRLFLFLPRCCSRNNKIWGQMEPAISWATRRIATRRILLTVIWTTTSHRPGNKGSKNHYDNWKMLFLLKRIKFRIW